MKQCLLIAALIIGSFVIRAQSNLASCDSKSEVITIAACVCNQFCDNTETKTRVRLGFIRDSWDEENRLMAISQDGYVSNYWYDGDGARVIKEHGGNHAVFVNSAQDGVLTDTRQFTIYPSPYLTVHNGSWYTKHVYIGSERISSRMGAMSVDALSETFEANAILAGENVLEEIDYDGQCDTLSRVMRSNYACFDLPYNGENRHGEEMVSTPPRGGATGSSSGPRHYWMLGDSGDDGTDVSGEGGGPTRGPRRAENVDYNGNRYFYHSDHLGSSSLVTDASGNVTQQLDYLPYGEVFLEKRSDVDYHTPYKFNGKELDEETGLYYYGARYMNPRLSIWYGTDPMQEKYPNISSYTYCMGNPVLFLDPNGQILYISGECADNAYSQLVEKYKDSNLSLNKDDNGLISYTISDDKKLKGDAKKIAEIIDNEQITVCVDAVKEDTYSDLSFLGGAFMGAYYNKEMGTVQTKQVVNPEILGRIDDFYETPGKMMMHEITESYEAGKISLDKKLMIGFASESRNKDQMKYYNKAHNKATPQNPVFVTYYDKDGIKHNTDNIKTIKKIEYNVTSKDKNQVIHTIIRK